MKGIIDRFEDELVVVEIDGEMKDFAKSMFPPQVVVGDVVEIIGYQVKILENETNKLRKEIEELMDEVWE